MMDDIKDLGTSAKNGADRAKAAASTLSGLRQMPGNKLSELNSKVMSPLDQKKQAIEAAKMKAEAPVQLLQQKQQQLQAVTDAAQKKADAARKLLELKELASQKTKSESVRSISNQKALALKAKNSVGDRMKEVQAKGDALRSLLEKLEAQAQGALK